MSKPTKQDIEKWVKALRSEKYNQTRGTLQDSRGYCCLGVACKELIPENKLSFLNGIMWGELPGEQNCAPEWLIEIDDLVSYKSGHPLTSMNDEYCFSFDQIAEILEDLFIKELGSDLVKQKIKEFKVEAVKKCTQKI